MKMSNFAMLVIFQLMIYKQLSAANVIQTKDSINNQNNIWLSQDGLERSYYDPEIDEQPDCKCTNGKCVSKGEMVVCECPPEYGLGRDGVTCKECKCGTGSNCTFSKAMKFFEKKICICKKGYQEKLGTCVGPCTNNPCRNGGTCEDVTDGMKCKCPPGFMGATCDLEYFKWTTGGPRDFTDGVRRTTSNQWNYTVIFNRTSRGPFDFTGNFKRTTYAPRNYTMDIYRTTHDPRNVTYGFNKTTYAPRNFTMNFNRTTYEPRNYTYVYNRTTYMPRNYTTDFYRTTLNVTYGFNGTTYTTTSIPFTPTVETRSTTKQTDICANNDDCMNGGLCKVEQDGNNYCVCPSNFVGVWCEVFELCDRIQSRCGSFGAVCRRKGESAVCECPPERNFHWQTAKCEDICDNKKCEHGTCEIFGKQYKCRCDTGYTGQRCEKQIAENQGLIEYTSD